MGLKLNKTTVDGLEFDGSQKDYFDNVLRGFGIRVSRESKTFFVRAVVAGKRTRVKIGRYGVFTCDQARQQAIELLARLQTGLDVNAERKADSNRLETLSSVLEKYFVARQRLKPRTIETYRAFFRLYLADWMALPIDRITKEMVATRHLKISAEYGRGAADNCMRTFRAIYNFANEILDDTLGVNPVRRLTHTRQWNQLERKTSSIPPGQLPAFYEAVNELDNPVAKDFLLMLFFTGARFLEMAILKWESVDMDVRTFTLSITKSGRPLTLPMSEPVFEIFKRREYYRESDYVFPGPGRSGHIANVKKNIARITEKIGLHFSPHDLRRTFAGIASQIVGAYELKRLLNHAIQKGDVTDGYVTQDPERLRPAAEKVSKRIMTLVEPEEGKVIPLFKAAI